MTQQQTAIEPKTPMQKIRHFLWPIYGKEHLKFVPMTCMISLILFNYTLVRQMKDNLVTTTTGSSEIIVFLKGWAVLPSALFFFFIYSMLTNYFKRQTVFYGIVLFFMGFFALYGMVLYPPRVRIPC